MSEVNPTFEDRVKVMIAFAYTTSVQIGNYRTIVTFKLANGDTYISESTFTDDGYNEKTGVQIATEKFRVRLLKILEGTYE
jgi:hypothetical protein